MEKEEIFCYSCLSWNLMSKAASFYKTCEVREPLCTNCTQQHIRDKISRGHKLCENMEELSSLHTFIKRE